MSAKLIPDINKMSNFLVCIILWFDAQRCDVNRSLATLTRLIAKRPIQMGIFGR